MSERRFKAIENQLQHQEALLGDLNQVIYQQQTVIALLQRRIQQVEEQSVPEGQKPHSEKPPHY
jgi:uncharacterized coiled-coil protein SlyX